MKKIIYILFFMFTCISTLEAKSINVKFSNCVDGDTAKFIYKNEEITARFLAIDTPETVHPTKDVEEYGKEASDYTCEKLKNATKIILEYDEDSDELDKYDRHLVWVFVDGELLQKKLVSKGLASVAYLYGDYKYTNELESAEQDAEDKKIGIWSINNTESSNKTDKNYIDKDEKEKNINVVEEYKEYIILIGSLIIVSMFNLKSKNKVKKKLKNKIETDIKKRLK